MTRTARMRLEAVHFRSANFRSLNAHFRVADFSIIEKLIPISRASYSCLVLSSGRKLENSEHQPLDVRAFADLDENCCVTCLCARVVHRLARRSVCNDRNKHEPVAAGRQPQDLEAANFHLGSKKIGGFRTSVLGCNHSGWRLTIASKNRASDEPIPKDFEVHRTRNARARTRVFRVPLPERPASRRCRNAQLISRFSLTILRAVLIRLSCPHSSGRDGSPVAPITAYRSFGQTIRLTINSGRYTHDLCARHGVATDLSQSEDLQVGIATSMSMADRRRTDWH